MLDLERVDCLAKVRGVAFDVYPVTHRERAVGGALLAVYLAVTIVTIGPAWRVSGLSPAEAVRYSE